ncbi:MAG TPA: fumarylacetoacetate hydrolase family protein [Thermomicrobiales bacterium]|jgi:2-oxo-3-hexenedioate decarboxylase|nr:fumarylacetoacetate hydrolase family protein [Thermomicrobiales bacterium]
MTGSANAVTSVQVVAAEAFDLLDSGRQVAPFSSRLPRFDLDDAYRVTAAVRQMRETRGEIPLGRKIGFTNRTIWDEYQIGAPMWGYIYNRTVRDLADLGTTVSLAGLAEPRIEPEIIFGLAMAPEPGMDERALLGCIDWVAHGFELVQSIFPQWEFTLPDTVAAYGLHGMLLVGPRHTLVEHGGDWLGNLSTFGIDLTRDGTVIDQGRAANVLGGPLSALRHLVEVLASDPVNPPLAAGEIVTTGTLTRAFPVAPGETWTTELSGIALDGIAIRFA